MKKTDRQRLLNTLVQIDYGQKAASLLMEEQDRLFHQQIRRHIDLHGDLNRYIHGLSRVTCGFVNQASRELKELTKDTDHISSTNADVRNLMQLSIKMKRFLLEFHLWFLLSFMPADSSKFLFFFRQC